MRGIAWLSWRALRARPLVSALLALCIGIAVALPITSTALLQRFNASLHARADTTPIVVGPDVSRFDLVLATLYFRDADIGALTAAADREAQRDGLLVVPIHLGSTVRGRALVGVDDRYYSARELTTRTGTLPFRLGEAVLGATTARSLGVGVGDEITTDPPEGLDLASPTAVTLTVVGVLAPAGTPDDDALFVTLPTSWYCAGLVHGHDDAERFEDETTVIGRTDGHTTLSNAVRTAQRVDDDNRASFHFHTDPDEMPLTALIIIPETEKDATLALARLDALPSQRALRTERVVDELLATVVRFKSAIDVISLLFGVTTGVLLALVFALSARLRAEESRTIRDIGAARHTPALLLATEAGMLLFVGLALAAALSVGVIAFVERTLIWI